jgi:hypothetical protein
MKHASWHKTANYKFANGKKIFKTYEEISAYCAKYSIKKGYIKAIYPQKDK